MTVIKFRMFLRLNSPWLCPLDWNVHRLNMGRFLLVFLFCRFPKSQFSKTHYNNVSTQIILSSLDFSKSDLSYVWSIFVRSIHLALISENGTIGRWKFLLEDEDHSGKVLVSCVRSPDRFRNVRGTYPDPDLWTLWKSSKFDSSPTNELLVLLNSWNNFSFILPHISSDTSAICSSFILRTA